jgi:prepilin-type N-terminal cleavage/methylation domain-containing protein
MMMLKKNDGFSLVELLIVMVILLVVLAIASDAFRTVARSASTQTRIAETQMETDIGLQMLKTDVESAGQGLPWAFQQTISYAELNTGQPSGSLQGSIYNDSTSNVPRAFVVGESVGLNNSDYFVIKSTRGMSDSSQKWSYIDRTGIPYDWGVGDTNRLLAGDYVTLIRPQTGENVYRQLITSSTGVFTATLANYTNFQLRPGDIIYGIDNTLPRMPFNRTDYFIAKPATMPTFCAPGTGILYKATVNHNNGNMTQYPLMDCVLAMRVELGLDMNDNGIIGTYASGLSGDTAGGPVNNVTDSSYESEGASPSNVQAVLTNPLMLRNRLKEVRVYVLAHEGRRDPDYTYSNAATVDLGDFLSIGFRGAINLSTLVGDDYVRYRWKVYRAVIKMSNL